MSMDVFCQETGAGSTVLCLHPHVSASQGFDEISSLSESFRLLAWDAPGFGRSPDPTGQPGLSWYAEQAAALLASRSDGPVHLLGVSWGGLIAMQLALDAPQLVKSLVLADSLVGLVGDVDAADQMRDRVRLLAQDGSAVFAKQEAPQLVTSQAPSELIDKVAETIVSAVRVPGFEAAVSSMVEADLTALLHSVRVPTLVLCGDADGVTGIEQSQRVANAIPNAVFVTITGAGHLAHQEKPDSFIAWLHSFLRIVDNVRETAEV